MARTRPGSALAVALALALAGCGQPAPVRAADVVVMPRPEVVRALPPAPAAPPSTEPAPDAAEVPAPEAAPAPAPDPAPSSVETSGEAEARVVELLNAARAEAGPAPLQRMAGLDDVARGWSSQLAADGAALAHNPSFSTQIPAGWGVAGENVAWAPVGHAGSAGAIAEAVHRMWMDSEGHRANILGAFTHVGVGAAYSPTHGWYLTQDFAAY